MWELARKHEDECNLSSLRVRGILVISHDRGFPIKGTLWKPQKDDDFLIEKGVKEKRKHGVLSSQKKVF